MSLLLPSCVWALSLTTRNSIDVVVEPVHPCFIRP